MPRADDLVRRHCTLALFAAAILQACAKAPAPPVMERILRPRLHALIAEAPDRERRVVARLEVPLEVEPWTVEASERRVKSVQQAPGGAAVRELMLLGRAEKALTIPLDRASAPFNRIELMLRIARADTLEVELSLAGRELAFVTQALRASQHEQVIGVDVPYPADLSVDRIVLRVTREGPVTFGPIELVSEPWRTRLPPPEGPARLIEIGSDLRRAVGASSARPMEASFDAGPGMELAFGYGVPDAFTGAAHAAALVVSLSVDGALETRSRFALATESALPRAWHGVRLPLAAYAGRQVRARFTIETESTTEAVCAISEPEVFRPSEHAPTVLLITSDTHRADHLGMLARESSAGTSATVATPALDALAERALVFDECFSSSNVTIPSHVAIMTGTHPRDTRVVHNNQLVSDDAHTLAERFRERGFATIAAISASHLDDSASGLGQGFDRVATTHEAKRKAATTLAALWPALEDAQEKPLFVWLHLFDAHTPYAPPSPFDRAYYPKDKDPFEADLPPPDLDPRLFPTNMPGLKDLEYPASQYRGEVSYLDAELARLFAVPRIARGIVAFTADHGESFGAHGVWWEHAELYPETIHVPLVIADPGVVSAERVRTRVSQLDLGRTLLDLAGLSDAEFPGTSFTSSERAKSTPVYTLSAYGFSASITSGPWHLILHLETHPIDASRVQPFKQRHEVELYDLDDDPRAVHDLSRKEHARAAAMRKALIQWLAQRAGAGLKTDGAQDAETLARLAQLGYVSPDVTRDTEESWFDASCTCAACRAFD